MANLTAVPLPNTFSKRQQYSDNNHTVRYPVSVKNADDTGSKEYPDEFKQVRIEVLW